MEEVRLKRISVPELRKILRSGAGMALAGLGFLILGAVLALALNLDRYGGKGVDAVPVAASITGCESVVVPAGTGDADVYQERFYFTAEFMLDGTRHSAMLDDYVVDKSFARERMGEAVGLHVDRFTGEVLPERPFAAWPFGFSVFGFFFMVAGLLLRFRYADYRARLMPRHGRFGRGARRAGMGSLKTVDGGSGLC